MSDDSSVPSERSASGERCGGQMGKAERYARALVRAEAYVAEAGAILGWSFDKSQTREIAMRVLKAVPGVIK